MSYILINPYVFFSAQIKLWFKTQHNLYKILGKLSVPNLGGSIHPETGFQLFLTERTAEVTDNNVNINSDIAKIAKVIILILLFNTYLKMFHWTMLATDISHYIKKKTLLIKKILGMAIRLIFGPESDSYKNPWKIKRIPDPDSSNILKP